MLFKEDGSTVNLSSLKSKVTREELKQLFADADVMSREEFAAKYNSWIESGKLDLGEAVRIMMGELSDNYLFSTPDSELTPFQQRIKQIRSTERLTSKDLNLTINC